MKLFHERQWFFWKYWVQSSNFNIKPCVFLEPPLTRKFQRVFLLLQIVNSSISLKMQWGGKKSALFFVISPFFAKSVPNCIKHQVVVKKKPAENTTGELKRYLYLLKRAQRVLCVYGCGSSQSWFPECTVRFLGRKLLLESVLLGQAKI